MKSKLHLLAWILAPLALQACQQAGTRLEGAGADRAPAAAFTPRSEHPITMEELRAAGAEHGVEISLPTFERTPEDVVATVDAALAAADARLAALAAQDPAGATFASTIFELENLFYPVSTALNRIYLMLESRPEDEVRSTCNEQVQRVSEWYVSVSIREDVYAPCKAYADALAAGARPALERENLRLFEETMRDYRRAGFDLGAKEREAIAKKLNELNQLQTRFDKNITDASVVLQLTAGELEGVPESFLEASRTDSGRHAVRVTVTPDYLTVMENARSEEVRRAVNRARYSIVQEENGPILDAMVQLRAEIARDLGYATWADFQTEIKMARSGARAIAFVEELAAGLQPKFEAEVQALRALKAAETGDPEARIHWWDFRYYQNQLMKEQFQVDSSALRVYFETERVLEGMFDVYEEIFGLEIRWVDPPYRWVDDLRLYAVVDARTGEPMGMLYMDLFPRKGKYNHFAQFDVIGGKALPDGRYQRPVAALLCNFTPGVGDEPSLMTHNEVETIFHEFGHAMHTILTRAQYSRFAGANVPRDFVEAPSQMFENWVWDARVLRRFAVDYRDPSKTIPAATIARMKEAELATIGVTYRRQCALALCDLRLHTGGVTDAAATANSINAGVFFEPPEGTNFCAYWGHLTGYDAGYYGYAWADSIAADFATVFESAPNRYLDAGAGRKLREEIYAVGGSRDVNESVERFLGRATNGDAFLRSIGVSSSPRASSRSAEASERKRRTWTW